MVVPRLGHRVSVAEKVQRAKSHMVYLDVFVQGYTAVPDPNEPSELLGQDEPVVIVVGQSAPGLERLIAPAAAEGRVPVAIVFA